MFHDDQHGTAIVAAAAVYNALRIVDKKIEDVVLTVSGAGAASLACIDLVVSMGLRKENVYVCDRKGVIYKGRTAGMNEYKERFAVQTEKRTLDDAIEGADIFFGLSGPGLLSKSMSRRWPSGPSSSPWRIPLPRSCPRRPGRLGRMRSWRRGVGLSQPGQQRLVLSVYLPRGAGLRCHRDQRSDEDRLC